MKRAFINTVIDCPVQTTISIMQTDTECTNAPESADSGIIFFGDKKVKYLKPRIGTYFQAKVDKYVAPTSQMADEDEEATAMKPPSLPCSQKLVEVSDSVSSKRRRRGSYNATRSDQGMFFKTVIYDIVCLVYIEFLNYIPLLLRSIAILSGVTRIQCRFIRT